MKKYSSFSMLLKFYRKSNYYTQEEAGRYLGYSRETIKAWENGKRFPKYEEIPRLAELMGVDAQELEQAVNNSRLDNYISKTQSKVAFMEEAMNAVSSMPVLPSTLMQIIPVQKHLLSRRQAIVLLTSFPAAIFRLSETDESLSFYPEEVIALCAIYIPLCWQIYYEGGLTEVQQILPAYLARLSPLLQNASLYQKQAATLASKAYQLATCLEMHQHHFENALNYAQLAIRYDQMAEDADLQVAALIQRANVYFNFHQPAQELETYQEALLLHDDISPLLKGRTYIGLAKAHARYKQEQEAVQFLEMAHKYYPERPEDDLSFNYTCHNRFTLINHTELTYLYLAQPTYLEQAWNIFNDIDQIVPKALVPRRLELSLRQSMALLALDDIKQCCDYLETAVIGAKLLNSPLRYNEALMLYNDLRKKWKNERAIKALQRHFHH